MLTRLQKRCVEISYQHKLSHLSSVLSTVDLIERIYSFDLQVNDPFVLGNSHASLALFVVLEKFGQCDAVAMMLKHGTHAHRDMEMGIWVSGGSLGQAETVAVGLALGDPKHTTWLVTSDGACMEGSVWESMRIAKHKHLDNLKVYVLFNGHGAYGLIKSTQVAEATSGLAEMVVPETSLWPKWLQGLAGHYVVMNQAQYEELMAL